MRIIRTTHTDDPAARGAAVAMGNFDGVHLGHRSVIGTAMRIASETGAPSGVLTFEPHPRRFFAPEAPAFRLMDPASRMHRLEKMGLDLLYELPFDRALAALSDTEFARDVLCRGLGVRHVVVGQDFRFGRNRSGDAARLEALGAEFGFGVTAAPLVRSNGVNTSSTAIRDALAAGRPDLARDMLGHWHRIEGRVAHGDKRGREMGFPTANLVLGDLHLPAFGIYAVIVDVLDGPHAGRYHGAASLGTRPTFGEHIPNLEVFLLDFSGDLYEAELSVGLVAYIRPELKFEGMEPLIARMHEDCVESRRILAARAPI